MPTLHHIAIETADLDNSAAWYRAFFDGCEHRWDLDQFSDLTRSRLPGIRRMVELQADDVRFHIMESTTVSGHSQAEVLPSFQHCGMLVSSVGDLERLRRRWTQLYDSGEYVFARADPPSDVVFDGDGVGSLYVLDPNGLEFEFTYVPPTAER